MADNCIICDVAIVGSGFAGSLLAKELSERRKDIKVVILEAGPGIQPNINDYLRRFYKASVKVPESPYPPALADSNNKPIDPANVAAGRPTSLTLSPSNWNDPHQAYLDQTNLDQTKTRRPFKSTYERLAGGTSHWLGLAPRLVANDFRMHTTYGKESSVWADPATDWPGSINSTTMSSYYARAEAELGVSADVKEQNFLDISFAEPKDYAYPMPRIPPSVFDQRVGDALARLTSEETNFLGMGKPVTGLRVRSLPAARNSRPYRNRRACAGNTNCIPICPIQAKYDPTITLNEATNNGARLIDHAVASEILIENNLISGISFITWNEAGPKTENGCIKAKIYVIAANGIETPRLLLMSKNGGRTANGVANSSDMVGRNLMDHPQYVVWGLLPPNSKPAFPYRGPLVTSAIGDLCDGPFRATRAAFRVSLGNEGWNFVVGGGAFGADPHVTTLDFVNGMNSSGLNMRIFSQLAVDNSALFGAGLAQTLSDLISRQFRIAFAVEQSPDPNNRVTLSSFSDALNLPRPQIAYDISDYTKQGIVTAVRMKRLIFSKLIALDFTERRKGDPAGFDETIDGKPEQLTYGGAGHIMGTYRMGDDPKTSVVDSWQRSHDHPNLYLVGSGTFPTVGTANPTLTLSALALRTADSIVKDFKPHG
jgi:glucose dehydrogenase